MLGHFSKPLIQFSLPSFAFFAQPSSHRLNGKIFRHFSCLHFGESPPPIFAWAVNRKMNDCQAGRNSSFNSCPHPFCFFSAWLQPLEFLTQFLALIVVACKDVVVVTGCYCCVFAVSRVFTMPKTLITWRCYLLLIVGRTFWLVSFHFLLDWYALV